MRYISCARRVRRQKCNVYGQFHVQYTINISGASWRDVNSKQQKMGICKNIDRKNMYLYTLTPIRILRNIHLVTSALIDANMRKRNHATHLFAPLLSRLDYSTLSSQ